MHLAEVILAVCVAALGSGGLFAFIQFLVDRRDKKRGNSFATQKALEEIKEKQEEQKHKMSALELDSCRTQLILLIKTYPEDHHEIQMVAQRYFEELGGNWYVDEIFTKWLKEQKVERPKWFHGGESR